MTVTTPRNRLNIGMIMLIIAYLAVVVASVSATLRDRTRPDFLMAIYALFAAITAATAFSRNSGRTLAGGWGQNLGILFVFFVGEIWYSLIWSPAPSTTNAPTLGNVLYLIFWNHWPILAAIASGALGNYIARKRYDRLHASNAVTPTLPTSS